MLRTAILVALGLADPPLLLRPEEHASPDLLCAAIGEQAACLLPHEALYVYWGEPGQSHLDLRFAQLAVPPPLPFPDYAGWLRDNCFTPVPVRLERAEWACEPRPWSGGDEHWLDLPIPPRLLLRYRLPQPFKPDQRHRPRLLRWMHAGREALERVTLP